MEARFFGRNWPWAAAAAVALIAWCPSASRAAGYRTTNFTVDAPTPHLAKEIGETAEEWRRELAQEWLGKELPRWSKPCPVKARVSPQLGAGGATSFVFDRGLVFGWDMRIQGSRERILDSVLPHEVMHTVFATHFRRPLPRWADEGACTTVEHRSEIAKQERMLIAFLKSRPSKGIPFNDMFAMKEYPQDVLPLYAQGHSLARFLIDQRGKRAFLTFLGDGMTDENWPRAIRQHYGYEHLLALQNSWMGWIRAGRPPIQPASDGSLLAGEPPTPPSASEVAASVVAASGQIAQEQAPQARGAIDATSASWSASPPVTPTAPASDDSAAVTPTPRDRSSRGNSAYSDWSTRPARYASTTAADPATGGAVWR
jgi:hypothetical protein